MSTSARMLTLLSLLQSHRFWPGEQLATRLEVSDRTLRRDIERLRSLGYVVDASRGVAGGYQLRPGGALPPLLLDDDEAVAIAVGLHGSTAGAVAGQGEAAVQALTKVLGLMPPRLRRRIDALASQTESPGPWPDAPTFDAATLTTLAQACRDDELVGFGYTGRPAPGDDAGRTSQRRVEPHRLVALGRRWYLVAYDRDRHDWRSFRLDRVSDVVTTGRRFRPRELPAPDALSFVERGIRTMPHRHDVRIRFAAPAAAVRAVIGRHGDVVDDDRGGCLLHLQVDTLQWPLMVLAALDASFVVESPAELRDEVARVARSFSRAGSR